MGSNPLFLANEFKFDEMSFGMVGLGDFLFF